MESIITGRSEEYKVFDNSVKQAIADVERMLAEHRPPVGGEHYLTTEEVCINFRISTRALQKYRDN